MDSDTHEWIKDAYIKSDKTGSIAEILNFEVQDVVPKGNNFVSDIYRIIMEVRCSSGETEKVSVIYKLIPQSPDFKLKGLIESGVFDVEAMMYIDILPKLQILLNEYLPKAQPSWPRLYASKPKHEGFLLEDISIPGYVMAKKWKGLGFDQIVLALKSVSRFHALAAVKLARGELKHEKLNNTYLFLSNDVITKNIFGNTIFNLIKVIEEHWKGEWLEYVPGLTKLSETFFDSVHDGFKTDEHKFYTINHGDLWTNNLLFKYDEHGKSESVKMVDWQLVYLNHPGGDIQYIFNTSLKGELFPKRPELLRTYYKALIEELEQFEYPGDLPSFEYIKECYQSTRLFGFLIAFAFRPVMMTRNYYDFLEKYEEKDRSRPYSAMAYGSEEVISSAKIILKEARKDGLF